MVDVKVGDNFPGENPCDPNAKRDYDSAISFRRAHKDSEAHPHSLLPQYVTGISLEDEINLANRMIVDKQKVRAKYGLPDETLKSSNSDKYIEMLKQIAADNGITITTAGYQWKRNDIPMATGPCYDEKIRTIHWTDKNITTLEHELVHGLQDRNRSNIETREYEAYECSVNTAILNTDGDANNMGRADGIGIIWGKISISVVGHYKEEGLNNPWAKDIVLT